LETSWQEEQNKWNDPMMHQRRTRSKRSSGAGSSPNRLVQAYRQAPWRLQTQRGVLLLIVAILGASVLWVMISVTVQAAAAGLKIQELEDEQERLQRQIAGLRTQIAMQTSAEVIKKRAKDLKFEPVDPASVTYVVIPGYKGREPDIQAPPPSTTVRQSLVKPAYTQSLWEWLLEGALTISQPTIEPVGGSPP
jgi:cell division protein FtsB